MFAVEDTSLQLTWPRLDDGDGDVVLRVGDVEVALDAERAAAPGAASVDGLRPATTYDVVLRRGKEESVVTTVRTLAPPPGELLFRLATISDTHVGERGFGLLPRYREDPVVPAVDAYPARCARAAIGEAVAWGAGHIVAKGDLTWSGRPLQWQTIGEILAASPVPVSATLGNHDVVPKATDGRDALARYGIVIPRGPEAVDLPGLRVVIGHSADRSHRLGVMPATQRAELVDLVGDAPGPVMLTMHHYVDPLPIRSRYPRGIRRSEGEALLRAVAAANPATFVTFGHTHRNRRRRHHGLPTTEVGSTKDYPGVWAGYAVHEGGIRQVVRRVAEPSCLAWTEPTAGVLGGAWGRWSPGLRRWRCFSWTWPPQGR